MNAFEYQQFFDFARRHWWFLGTRRIICDAIEQATAAIPRPRLIDVGCGAGNVLETLGERFVRFGLDSEQGALDVCRSHMSAPVTRGTAIALPYADAAFDAVVVTDLFEHVQDDALVARECARVCRPDGVLIAAVPAHPILFGPHDVRLHHFRRYRAAAFRRILEDAGFVIHRLTYFNCILFPPIVLVRLAQRLLIRNPDTYTINYRVGAGTGVLGRAALAAFGLERWWLRRANLGLGVSLMAVATRPAP